MGVEEINETEMEGMPGNDDTQRWDLNGMG
jgi:hypothetical protein